MVCQIGITTGRMPRRQGRRICWIGLADKIKAAHRDNPRFQAAFDSFPTSSPAVSKQPGCCANISQAAVDEMLVQHLLTERLIRKIFDNPEFTRRNDTIHFCSCASVRGGKFFGREADKLGPGSYIENKQSPIRTAR